jgi:hypothetical protein
VPACGRPIDAALYAAAGFAARHPIEGEAVLLEH